MSLRHCISLLCRQMRFSEVGVDLRLFGSVDGEPVGWSAGCKGLESGILVPGVSWNKSLSDLEGWVNLLLSGCFGAMVMTVSILKHLYSYTNEERKQTRIWRWVHMGFLILSAWDIAISSSLKWDYTGCTCKPFSLVPGIGRGFQW